MKLTSLIFAGTVLASSLPLSVWAQPEPGHSAPGAEKPINDYNDIEVKNAQDQKLGRIKDLGIDLVNGRIVEVLVVTDSSIDPENHVRGVPPLALKLDPALKVYRLDVSTDTFKSAAIINLKEWRDSGRTERVAATYRLFGQEPYFLENADTASVADRESKVPLGYVERSNKILSLPVANSANEKFGEVSGLTLDILRGRIRSVIILAPGNLQTRSVVPAMALSFNAARDGLVLEDTKEEYSDEPRYLLTEATYGQEAYSREESYKGPHTTVALVQGESYRDLNRTVRISHDIRAAKLDGRHVEVGTLDGRVTLRGWVNSDVDKRRIGEIAVADSRVELVDNQIVVGRPVTLN